MKKYILTFGLTLLMGFYFANDTIAQGPTWAFDDPYYTTLDWLETPRLRATDRIVTGIVRPGPILRMDVGHSANVGAGFELYRMNHPDRPGEFRFVYGGGDFGSVMYIHYNGANYIEKMTLDKDGNLDLFDGNLRVGGKIVTTELEVKLDVWPDFVFADDYELMSLYEVENYIKQNRHLPNVPSEAQVLESGVNVGEMTSILLQKVEELTLHIIELNKRIEELEK